MIYKALYRASAGVTVPETTWTKSRHTGPGRPRKEVDLEVLEDTYRNGQKIPKTVLAQVLQIDWKTLRTRLNELGVDTGFSSISDADLDLLVKLYHSEHPNGGRGYVAGWLRSQHNLCVQRKGIIMSMIRVDKLGHGMKQSQLQKKT